LLGGENFVELGGIGGAAAVFPFFGKPGDGDIGIADEGEVGGELFAFAFAPLEKVGGLKAVGAGFNQFGDLERSALRPGNVHSADGWRAVLEPVVARYRERDLRCYFRADAAFANPDVYAFLEAAEIKYAIRLPANRVLQERIGHLLRRPVGRPPNHVRRFHASFSYQAASWSKPRRVVAKVEWHPGELYPRVGFIVTNLTRPAERVVAFYNRRGTAEQWIKEGTNEVKWTRLSCGTISIST
jgi:hypothetical protein